MDDDIKGTKREQFLEKEAYFTEHYFSLRQLCSFAHQIHFIHQLKPRHILEIGIGNGFTSTYLRRAGIDVCTVDINATLEPDIVAPIAELPNIPELNDRHFDLVVCCEVLEHMPFENFQPSIEIFRRYAGRLFLTLPGYKRWRGISGFEQLRGRRPRPFQIGRHVREAHKTLAQSPHFWEIDSHEYSSPVELQRLLRAHYTKVQFGTFTLNPAHQYFICE